MERGGGMEEGREQGERGGEGREGKQRRARLFPFSTSIAPVVFQFQGAAASDCSENRARGGG